MSQRFRPSSRDSFWGDALYEMAVPPSHFLRQLRHAIDWDRLTEGLADLYKGGAEYGPVPYHPSVLLRMLLISYLYNLSERQTEEYVNDSLSAKYFLGLAVHEAAPDHSSLSVFKERLLKREGPGAFEKLFQQIVRAAQEKGIKLGRIQVVDATHSIADVDVKKDDERQQRGGKPRDEDAAWGSKGRKRVRTAEGKMVLVNRSFYGYKAHLSLDAQSEIITSVVVTAGHRPDGQEFSKLVQADEEAGIEAAIYAGDKGYDESPAATEMLFCRGKSSALCLNRYRTEKYPEGLWAELKASEDYQAGLRERYKIEQKNAEAKRRHGLGRCRYLGLAKYAVQAFLTAMVMNLKRMVWLWCGTRFRGTVGGLVRA
jgi:IS5 family transposase